MLPYILSILLFAVIFVIGLLISGGTHLPWGNWGAIINLSLLFAVCGAFYGTIAFLDKESKMTKGKDQPKLRTFLCGIFGAISVLLVQSWEPQTFNVIGPTIGFIIGAILGWLGWAWAKYVDF